MRTLATALLLFLAAPAFGQSPRATVFAHECKQIDPKITGFECRFTEDGMQLYWLEKPSEMSPKRKEKAVYEFERIALRYRELGGRHFTVRFASWPSNRERSCGFPRGSRSYFCNDCTWKKVDGGGQVCE